ncbi:sulfotransferase domain-containing protein [Methylobacterium sp. Leaf456]|uniref:sulfotransferase domain-containing protein n=1 Tax=Methylobacterium sp. Leaf456 TaxID=1736382 RepID=UPI00190FF52A|nr:sulfotransferase domain-containing protein [Methylobacterium sp. Leaf456]
MKFLVAGVQKGATTALFFYLARHPDLQAPQIKELHIFDDDNWLDTAPPFDRLHAAYPIADDRLRFEATPITIYWPNALERVRRYRTDIRLIFLFRDPVERAFSHWKMEFARCREDQSFAWCVGPGRKRVGTAHRVYSYVERGFYGTQLERIRALFPREQILCLTTTALRYAPAATLERITDFLGIRPFPPLEYRIVRPEISAVREPSDVLDPVLAAELRDLYADEMILFEKLSGISAEELVEQ